MVRRPIGWCTAFGQQVASGMQQNFSEHRRRQFSECFFNVSSCSSTYFACGQSVLALAALASVARSRLWVLCLLAQLLVGAPMPPVLRTSPGVPQGYRVGRPPHRTRAAVTPSQAVVPVGSPQLAPHCRLIGLLYPAVWGRLCFRKRSRPVASHRRWPVRPYLPTLAAKAGTRRCFSVKTRPVLIVSL